MLLKNKYYKWYYQIVNRARKRGVPEGYYEKHHVIPRCMGGKGDWWNIVKLSFKEHFLCHWLLTKCTTDPYHHKMKHALHRMCKGNNGSIRASWQYEVAKKLHRRAVTEWWTDDRRIQYGQLRKGKKSPKQAKHIAMLNARIAAAVSSDRRKILDERKARSLAKSRGEKLILTQKQATHLAKLAINSKGKMTEKHAVQLREIQSRPKTEKQMFNVIKAGQAHFTKLKNDADYVKKVTAPLREWQKVNKIRIKAGKNNKLGLKGVTQKSKGCFLSRIKIDGKIVRLGYFKTADEASAVYWQAAKVNFGIDKT